MAGRCFYRPVHVRAASRWAMKPSKRLLPSVPMCYRMSFTQKKTDSRYKALQSDLELRLAMVEQQLP